ncbi:hypothetical protein D3C76_1327990 [compost metagenome]
MLHIHLGVGHTFDHAPCIVHQNIHCAAEVGLNLLHHLIQLGRVGSISLEGMGLAACLADSFYGFHRVAIQVVDGDFSAGSSQSFSNLAAQACVGTGYECDFTCQIDMHMDESSHYWFGLNF